MSIWYSRRKKEEKSLRLAAAGKSAFCFAELHYNAFIANLTEKDKKTTEKGRKEAPFGLFERILSKN